jgi:hypothetical protein
MRNHFSNKELRIDNAPESVVLNMTVLREVILNPVRWIMGELITTSGYRDEDHNKEVGGADNSHHLCERGFAAVDLMPKSCTLRELFNFIKDNFLYAELILELDQGCVHVSRNINPELNNKRTSIRTKIDGKYKYQGL